MRGIQRVRDLHASARAADRTGRGGTHADLVRAAERGREVRGERIALAAARPRVCAVAPGVRPHVGVSPVLLPVDQRCGRVAGLVVGGGKAEVPHAAGGVLVWTAMGGRDVRPAGPGEVEAVGALHGGLDEGVAERRVGGGQGEEEDGEGRK